MKTWFAVAGLLAALNSSVVSARSFLITLQGASEPVGLVAWGVALFVVAASIKRHGRGTRVARCEKAPPVKFPLTRLERGLH